MLYAGLDLGQRRDHSAIAVVERYELYRYGQGPKLNHLAVRYLERLPLGTPYGDVVERVRKMTRAMREAGGCALAVDGTGVGAPVVEMLRGAGLGCEVTAVTITGGEKERHAGGWWSVPKLDLVAGLQLLVERGELRIARRLREAPALLREMADMKTTVGRGGHVRQAAEGTGEHDDLVTALGLACWRARRRTGGEVGQRLPGI